jgi:Cft2 family RNA processing exonuclease
MSATITFLGGADTVTGSKYLIEHKQKRLLVDCGLFQGYKQLRLRNWGPLPANPANIDAVVLTHAHLDHSGYLPLLVKNGFRGRVHATAATCALASILLPDSGHIQEEDAFLPTDTVFPNTLQRCLCTPNKRPSKASNNYTLRTKASGSNRSAVGSAAFSPQGTFWAQPACCWKWAGGAFCFQATWVAPTTR